MKSVDVGVFRKHLQAVMNEATHNAELRGKDLLLEAMRRATGDTKLELPMADRRLVKQVAYSLLYGASDSVAFNNLLH